MNIALGSTRRVILAEDHPIVRYGMRIAIESNHLGQVVAEASSPDELLAAVNSTPCDIVVTDFSMPSGESSDGLALIERLTRLYPNISIIVVTALRNPALLNAMLRRGVKGLVGKEGDITELREALQAVCRGGDYVSQQLKMVLLNAGTIESSGERPALTLREVEVLRLFAYEGLTSQQISERLNRSKKTVSRHKRSAQSKLGLHTNQELLEYCRQNELIAGEL